MSKYYVSLDDVYCTSGDITVQCVILPIVGSERKAIHHGEAGSDVVPLECDDDQAEAVIEVARMKLPAKSLRFYRYDGKWEKL